MCPSVRMKTLNFITRGQFWAFRYCVWMLTILPAIYGHFVIDFCIYGSHYSHTAWRKPIFIENYCFCKKIKSKMICNPDLIFRLAEHLVTLTLYTALPLYHSEEMCHPDLIFRPALLFSTWEYLDCFMVRTVSQSRHVACISAFTVALVC